MTMTNLNRLRNSIFGSLNLVERVAEQLPGGGLLFGVLDDLLGVRQLVAVAALRDATEHVLEPDR